MKTPTNRQPTCPRFCVGMAPGLGSPAQRRWTFAMPTDAHAPQPPSTAEEFCSRGMDRLRTGNWKDAIDDFTQAIRLRPDIAVGYRYRAIAHAEVGNVSRAISDLDQAIRLKPDDVQALYD